jgi:hypothetical protein
MYVEVWRPKYNGHQLIVSEAYNGKYFLNVHGLLW